VEELGAGNHAMAAMGQVEAIAAPLPADEPPGTARTAAALGPAKRAFDLVLGGMLLILFVLLFPIVMLAIKLNSPGPTVFRQWRVGRGGRLIPVYKFRSMYVDAEARLHASPELHARWTSNDCKLPADEDPRVTRVGRFLRMSSLDELPQVLNVLAGHMSVVGPRPVEQALLAPLYRDRTDIYLSVRPGLTGLWQVSGRSHVVGEDRADLDIAYIESWSLGLDARILLKTLPAVLRAEGAV
jgi:lipopolysaccharide/colanic/teichoic acid biosynthesis glycosyltransferase